jgi:glycine/serine hydroxymethyltransferase
MRPPQMEAIAGLIDRVLSQPGDAVAIASARQDVQELCRQYPLPDSIRAG